MSAPDWMLRTAVKAAWSATLNLLLLIFVVGLLTDAMMRSMQDDKLCPKCRRARPRF